MKLSLRNLALASTIAVAGTALAQTTPTVTKVWQTDLSATTANCRFGTGYNGTVYYADKGTAKVMAVTADGEKEFVSVSGLGSGITTDEAGNIIVNKGFSGVGSSANFVLIKPNGEQTPLSVTYPAGMTTGRYDQLGEVAGDVFSAEGGYLYTSPNANTKVAMFKIANGEVVASGVSPNTFAAFGTSTLAQAFYPASKLNEMGEDAVKGFALRTRGNKVIEYYDAEGNLTKTTAPAGATTSEGYSIFTLGDVIYQVQPSGDAYSSNFVVADAAGNIIFSDALTTLAGSGNYNSFATHKVSDHQVDLYVYYANSSNKQFAAYYTITIPEEVTPDPVELPTFYIRGDLNSWGTGDNYLMKYAGDAAAPVANENGEYEFTISLDKLSGSFKFASEDWNTFNYGAKGEDPVVENGKALESWSGSSENFQMKGLELENVTVTFLYQPDATKPSTVKVEGTVTVEPDPDPDFELPTFYIRGDLNGWGTGDNYLMKYTGDADAPVANENGEYEFTISLDKLSGSFKFASEDWNTFNYGAKGEDPVVENGKTLESWSGSSENFLMNDLELENVTVSFFYQPAAGKCSYVKVEGKEPTPPVVTTDRGQFAYNLAQEKLSGANYQISFDATGDAASAMLVLTEEGSEDKAYVELGEVKKGANSFTVDLEDYASEAGKKYDWAIEIHNYSIPNDIVTETINVGGGRAGVVCMTDPENEFYGYTVIGRTQNTGFDVYNQLGEKIMNAVHSKNAAMGGTAANGSCPMRGVQRGTTAQFACWGDAAIGVVAFDLANPDAEPFGVFEGTKASNGLITNAAGEAVGSGTPTVAYAGEGENTILFTFDEDAFKNKLAANPIGTAMTTSKPAENWGFGGAMANQNVGLVGTKNGLFFSQTRGNGMEEPTEGNTYAAYGLGYIDIAAKEITWCSTDEKEKYPDFLKSSTGGVDINPAGDLLAVSTYTGINVYLLSWDGDKPVLEPYKVIPTSNQANNYTALKFDAGNNIHVINQTKGYYQVILGEEEGLAVTPAKADDALRVMSGIETISYETEDATPVYYNLQGVRVNSDALTPGIYVKKVGKKATKVVIK